MAKAERENVLARHGSVTLDGSGLGTIESNRKRVALILSPHTANAYVVNFTESPGAAANGIRINAGIAPVQLVKAAYGDAIAMRLSLRGTAADVIQFAEFFAKD